MKKYYLHNGQSQSGPYDLNDLKTLNISSETPVWYEGLAGWQLAKNISELNQLFSTPPPFPQANNSKPVEPPAYKTGRSVGKWLWPTLITVILVLVAVFMYNQIRQQKDKEQIQNIARDVEDMRQVTKNNITTLVTAEGSKYFASGLGGIKGLEMSVSNNTDYIIDLVQVKVHYLRPDGTEWDNKVIDFNFINPHIKRTKSVEDTDRGVEVKYEIITIKSNALGL